MEETTGKEISTKRVIWVSLLIDLSDVILNIIVAVITGSTVMLTEALQGLSDLLSVTLLAVGYKRSKRHATQKHPFGFGKELFFWTIIAAFIMLIVTAGLSFWFGWHKFHHPQPIDDVWLAYALLAFAIGTNFYAFMVSARKLLGGRKLHQLFRIFMQSPLIAPKTTLVLDTMGTLSAMFGLVALAAYGLTGDGRWDGIGAMGMGIMLAVLSSTLLVSASSLVTGESLPQKQQELIKQAALSVPEVREVLGINTMILGSESALINIEIHLQNNLNTDQIERVVERVKQAINALHEELVVHIEVELPPQKHRR